MSRMNGIRSRSLVLVLVLGVGVGLASHARAGNDEGVLLGNDAALTGGAVVATVHEGSSLWYNPAGLADDDIATLDVSVTTFQLRNERAGALLSTPSGIRSGGSVTEILTIPSAATYVRRVSPKVQLGFGIFVSQASDAVLRAELVTDAGVQWTATLAETNAQYHIGAGVGWRPAANLYIGASLFAAYDSTNGNFQFSGGSTDETTGEARFGALSSLYSYKSIGLEAGAGVQWRPTPNVALGASLRTPTLQLFRTSRATTFVGAVNPTTMPMSGFVTDDSSFSDFEIGTSAPLTARIGAAMRWREGGVELDADMRPGLESDVTTPRDFTWNVRVGGTIRLSDTFALGAGAFTDRSPFRDTQEESAAPIDFYGASVGIQWRTAHRVVGADRPGFAAVSTLALRYAYGTGQTKGLSVPDDIDGEVLEVSTSVHVHEIALNLGSAFYF